MKSPFSTDKLAIEAAVIAESSSGESGLRTPASSEASMELRGRATIAEKIEGKARSPEKVMDKSRRYRKIDGVPGFGTDDTEDINEDFAGRILKSAILLKFDCVNFDADGRVTYLGQAGLLRNPKTGVVKFATCKHNLGTEENERGELEYCVKPHKCALVDHSITHINLPNTGWEKKPEHAVELRKGVKWDHGIDIALGPIVNENTAQENWPSDPVHARLLNLMFTERGLKSFDVVDDDFLYDVGLKIGIVARTTHAEVDDKDLEKAFSEIGGVDDIEIPDEASYATVAKGVKATKMSVVCGEADVVMIYTGQITYGDGKHHIEYNINTYKGCSGAIVIVMDRNHSAFGKALAIHAGYKHELGTNLGFKLAGAFDRCFDQTAS